MGVPQNFRERKEKAFNVRPKFHGSVARSGQAMTIPASCVTIFVGIVPCCPA